MIGGTRNVAWQRNEGQLGLEASQNAWEALCHATIFRTSRILGYVPRRQMAPMPGPGS